MKVVFLCGGIGKRMFPLTEDKFLLKFLGKPLLKHQIETAREVGLRDFVIVGNPKNIEKIKKVCEDVKEVEFCIQKEPKGMADALLSAKDLLEDDEIIVVNPNDVFEIEAYQKILKASRKNDHDSYIIGYRVNSYFPGGYLEVNKKNELKKIHEKPGKGKEPSNLINIVVHLHKNTRTLFHYLEKTKSRRDDIYECALSRMIKDKHRIKVIPYNGFWKAIKYPWDIFGVMEFFLGKIEKKSISPSAKISERACIHGKVMIEDEVRVLENVVIRGPCYIGKNSVIGNNVLIWNFSHIGENCVVGFSSEIKHSYVCDNCWFHTSYIGDSIISSNCSFGAGTVTANFRFDEKAIKVNVKGEMVDSGLDKLGAIIGSNCKTGVNSCLMPGIRIGPNSIVGPGVVLSKDLGSNKIILLDKKSYRVEDNKIIVPQKKKRELLKKLFEFENKESNI